LLEKQLVVNPLGSNLQQATLKMILILYYMPALTLLPLTAEEAQPALLQVLSGTIFACLQFMPSGGPGSIWINVTVK